MGFEEWRIPRPSLYPSDSSSGTSDSSASIPGYNTLRSEQTSVWKYPIHPQSQWSTVNDLLKNKKGSTESIRTMPNTSTSSRCPDTLSRVILNREPTESVPESCIEIIDKEEIMPNKQQSRMMKTDDRSWPEEHWTHPKNTLSTISTSSQSDSSDYLLLSAAKLVSIRDESPSNKPMDSISIASSTHFTIINDVSRRLNPSSKSCCRSNQITALVLTMSLIFSVVLLGVVAYFEVRAMEMYGKNEHQLY